MNQLAPMALWLDVPGRLVTEIVVSQGRDKLSRPTSSPSDGPGVPCCPRTTKVRAVAIPDPVSPHVCTSVTVDRLTPRAAATALLKFAEDEKCVEFTVPLAETMALLVPNVT